MGSLHLEECGRVLISTDHRLYVLDCNYCNELHTKWENFLAHIKTAHKQEAAQQMRNNLTNVTSTATAPLQLPVEKIEAEVQTGNASPSVVAAETRCVAVDSTVKEIHFANDAEMVVENFTADAADIDDCNDDMIFIEYLEDDEYECGATDAIYADVSLETEYYVNNEDVATAQFKADEHEEIVAVQDSTHLALTFETSTTLEMETFIANLKQHKCLWQRECMKMPNSEAQQEALLTLSEAIHKSIEATKESVDYLLHWFAKAYHFSNVRNNISATHKYYTLCEFLMESLPRTAIKTRAEQRKFEVIDAEHTFSCSYCDKQFLRRKYLDVHLRRHTKEYMYKCEICNKLTATSSDLRTHMRVHTGEKPYTCAVCGKTFKTSSVLCQHQRKHQKPSHQCTLCSKAYYNSYQLKNHMNVHLNKRAYNCVYCEKAFTSAKLLYGHKLNMHSELRNSYCKICQKCIPNIDYHTKQMHGEFALD